MNGKWFEGIRSWSVVVIMLVGGFILTGMGRCDKDIMIYIIGAAIGYVTGKFGASMPNGK